MAAPRATLLLRHLSSNVVTLGIHLFAVCGGGDIIRSLFSFSLRWNERAAMARSESSFPAAV